MDGPRRQETDTTQGSNRRAPRPWRQVVFGVGLALLIGLELLGLHEAWTERGELPAVQLEYVPHVNDAVRSGDLHGALEQMRLAALLDPNNPTVRHQLIPTMERLARDLGDRDTELLALRRLVRDRRGDALVHSRLATAILSAEALTLEQLKEAGGHAEIAVRADPNLAAGWHGLSLVAASFGQDERAAELRERAIALDPSLAERTGPPPRWSDRP